jgi:hypothetical protein
VLNEINEEKEKGKKNRKSICQIIIESIEMCGEGDGGMG